MHPHAHGFLIHGVRRPARSVGYNPVIEDKQSHGTTNGVVPMGYRLDDGLPQRLFRQFWSWLGLDPVDNVGNPEV
jgi:hypothetical protein